MIREIGALNAEMDAAGARFFAAGLESASHARSPRKQPDGSVSITDGPTQSQGTHRRFWILQCAHMDEALAARMSRLSRRLPGRAVSWRRIVAILP